MHQCKCYLEHGSYRVESWLPSTNTTVCSEYAWNHDRGWYIRPVSSTRVGGNYDQYQVQEGTANMASSISPNCPQGQGSWSGPNCHGSPYQIPFGQLAACHPYTNSANQTETLFHPLSHMATQTAFTTQNHSVKQQTPRSHPALPTTFPPTTNNSQVAPTWQLGMDPQLGDAQQSGRSCTDSYTRSSACAPVGNGNLTCNTNTNGIQHKEPQPSGSHSPMTQVTPSVPSIASNNSFPTPSGHNPGKLATPEDISSEVDEPRKIFNVDEDHANFLADFGWTEEDFERALDAAAAHAKRKFGL